MPVETPQSSGPEPSFALVAGELSGDRLGAGLIRALRKRYPQARFEGVTGPEMVAEGCHSLADVEALSLFGVGEVIREIPRLLRLRRDLKKHFLTRRPDVFVGIDAPAFNNTLEAQLRAGGLKTAHYVCPTVWAWRKGRVRHIRRAVDLMLSIFPFELPFLQENGVPARYVGHPLADELPINPDQAAARRALGLEAGTQYLALLPGSRRSEVAQLGRPLLETAAWLHERLPALRFVAPLATARVREIFEAQVAEFAPDLPLTCVDGQSRAVLTASDTALLASGTATLEAALLKTPMVVVYVLTPFNTVLARAFGLDRLEFFSMPNLVAGRGLVPEYRQQQVRPDILGMWTYQLLTSASARQRQLDGFKAIHEVLRCNADEQAADAIAALLADRA